MQLRKCCNHPFLIDGSEEQIISEMKLQHPIKSDDELQFYALIQSSGTNYFLKQCKNYFLLFR